MSHNINSTSPQTQSETPAVGQGFTPGPWQSQQTGRSWSVSRAGEPGWPLAECWTRARYENGQIVSASFNAEANARLIVEAPAMFDVLRRIAAEEERLDKSDDCDAGRLLALIQEALPILARASPATS